jgi:hypothetical protein
MAQSAERLKAPVASLHSRLVILFEAPEAWHSCLTTIDEIWAPSAFVAESFRSIFDRPITLIPPCIGLGSRLNQPTK